MILRPYQKQAIIDVRDAFKAGARGVLLTAPCGAGKTVIFCSIAESAQKRGKNILILVHRQELLHQASRKLTENGVEHGLIAPGRTMTLDHVQVASVQTLVRRLGKIPAPDLTIVDEAHHSGANSWTKILSYYPKSLILGVTATPIRHDGKPLGRSGGGFFDEIVIGPTIPELIRDGYLSPPIVYAPPGGADMSGLHTKFGDFDKNEVNERVDRAVITGNAVEHYLRICPGVPAIAFCASVSHAEHVAAEFNAAGIPSESIDGTLDDKARAYRIKALANGSIKVLTSCEIISEGTDIPVVTAAILLRPTQSLGVFIQQCGRVLRTHPLKRNSIILDHVGNVHRHGMVEEIREWSLDGDDNGQIKQKKDLSEAYRQCMTCYAVYAAYKQECPQCGAKWQPKLREIKQVDGELVKIDPYVDIENFRIEEAKKAYERRKGQMEVGMARSLEDLINIARARGYKLGWAYRIWGARQARGQRNSQVGSNSQIKMGV